MYSEGTFYLYFSKMYTNQFLLKFQNYVTCDICK